MIVGIVSDHRGIYLKKSLIEYLEHSGNKVINYGTDTVESVDFPLYARMLGDGINNKDVMYGIAICGTGIGMSIALNKMDNIYCAKISSINEAVLCREHNDANVVAIGADVSLELAKSMIDKFLSTPFSNGDKYIRRNNMIKDIEKNG